MTGSCGGREGFGFKASAGAAGLPRNGKDKAQGVGELAIEEVLGALLSDSIAKPRASPGRLMLEPLSDKVLELVVPSPLPSSNCERGETRKLALALVLLVAFIERESRAIKSCNNRGDCGAEMFTMGAAIQAPATTRSTWELPVPEVLPPSTRASTASRLTEILSLALEPDSKTILLACRLEP